MVKPSEKEGMKGETLGTIEISRHQEPRSVLLALASFHFDPALWVMTLQ
jgi:hypothetical protein